MPAPGSLSTLFTPRLPLIIPQTQDPALQQHVKGVTEAVNALPTFSVFSFSTPESNVSAIPGTLGQNLCSGVSVLWIKQSGFSSIGWRPLA
jgi:hypothetical protein